MHGIQDELSRRRPVWIALSDLWLDTELGEERLDQIAEILRDSGYSPDELRRIFRNELAPFLGWNQLVVAGAWTEFDPEWVCQKATSRMGKRNPLMALLVATGLLTYAAKEPWAAIEAKLTQPAS